MKTGLQEHKSVHMLTYFTPVICLFFSGCLRVWPDLAHWKPRPQWGKLKVQRSTRSSMASPCSPHHLPSDLTWPDLTWCSHCHVPSALCCITTVLAEAFECDGYFKQWPRIWQKLKWHQCAHVLKSGAFFFFFNKTENVQHSLCSSI